MARIYMLSHARKACQQNHRMQMTFSHQAVVCHPQYAAQCSLRMHCQSACKGLHSIKQKQQSTVQAKHTADRPAGAPACLLHAIMYKLLQQQMQLQHSQMLRHTQLCRCCLANSHCTTSATPQHHRISSHTQAYAATQANTSRHQSPWNHCAGTRLDCIMSNEQSLTRHAPLSQARAGT